ncbi:MAG: RecX family transcriptional regulator [Tatlockia sp.]|nr:RecX family transcriptional regulator [Tatlockia sp.]
MSSKQMMDQAMNYLSQGSCSERALRTRLENEFADEPNFLCRVNDTILRLHQLDLINDARIARQIAERYSHKGDTAIIHQLKVSKMDEATVRSALAFVGSEYQRALREAQRERLVSKEIGLPELQTKIMRLLSSRSFSFQTLCQVMDTLFNKPLTQSFNEPGSSRMNIIQEH